MRKTHPRAIAPSLTDKSSYRHSVEGLRTPGYLGKWPLIGLMMVVFGIAIFGVIMVNLQTNGPLIQADTRIVNDLHRVALQSSPFIRDVMIFGFYVGEQGVLIVGAILGLYFLYWRFWPEFSMVVIGLVGEGIIWFVLSRAVDRARPTFDVSVWRQMAPPSFPSGHTFGAVMCYGLLAYLLVPKVMSRFWKTVVILAALLIMLYVGFSRIFVGDHFPTDVVAGYALGLMWTGLVYTVVELKSPTVNKRKAM